MKTVGVAMKTKGEADGQDSGGSNDGHMRRGVREISGGGRGAGRGHGPVCLKKNTLNTYFP
jgi:hypothetical protein